MLSTNLLHSFIFLPDDVSTIEATIFCNCILISGYATTHPISYVQLYHTSLAQGFIYRRSFHLIIRTCRFISFFQIIQTGDLHLLSMKVFGFYLENVLALFAQVSVVAPIFAAFTFWLGIVYLLALDVLQQYFSYCGYLFVLADKCQWPSSSSLPLPIINNMLRIRFRYLT